MSKEQNSVNVCEDHAKPILKHLYSKYNERHGDASAINSYPFTPHILFPEFESQLTTLIDQIKDKHALNETSTTALRSVFNGFVKNELLVTHDKVIYHFTPKGYEFSLKYSCKIKYLFRYHSATFFAGLACLIGVVGVIATVATSG
ncbi:hypothetical protein [Shewanella holmiensis]|uniref:Uncharacterized protein n=1 Tax=Shewanella holmiensis TaxID=2952222 RepID=A0A9X3AQV1_9GAMM|nr:hypothetical protein [Shewanella holmiensis]MCT7943036.1 hypothetical protein [Shewanella holmiensis]